MDNLDPLAIGEDLPSRDFDVARLSSFSSPARLVKGRTEVVFDCPDVHGCSSFLLFDSDGGIVKGLTKLGDCDSVVIEDAGRIESGEFFVKSSFEFRQIMPLELCKESSIALFTVCCKLCSVKFEYLDDSLDSRVSGVDDIMSPDRTDSRAVFRASSS